MAERFVAPDTHTRFETVMRAGLRKIEMAGD